MAPQTELAYSRISREKHSDSRLPSPSLEVVATEGQCPPRAAPTSFTTRSSTVYHRLKRRLGRSLRRSYRKRFLVSARKQTKHKHVRAQSRVVGPKRVPGPLSGTGCPDSHGQHHCGLLYKQGGQYEVRIPLCSVMEAPVMVQSQEHHTSGAIYSGSPERDCRQAVSSQSGNPEWSLHQEVFNLLFQQWHTPEVDLFATRYNIKLPKFVSPVLDPQAWAVDALSFSWEDLDLYAFPPIPLLGNVVNKLLSNNCKRLTLIAPGWPNMPWFWDLVELSVQIPLCLPQHPNLVVQPFNGSLHRDPVRSEPSCLAPRVEAIKQQGFSDQVAARIEPPQRPLTRAISEAKWALFVRWCQSNQLDFRSPSIKQVADFLLFLFQEKRLQPSTIEGYRLVFSTGT